MKPRLLTASLPALCALLPIVYFSFKQPITNHYAVDAMIYLIVFIAGLIVAAVFYWLAIRSLPARFSGDSEHKLSCAEIILGLVAIMIGGSAVVASVEMMNG